MQNDPNIIRKFLSGRVAQGRSHDRAAGLLIRDKGALAVQCAFCRMGRTDSCRSRHMYDSGEDVCGGSDRTIHLHTSP